MEVRKGPGRPISRHDKSAIKSREAYASVPDGLCRSCTVRRRGKTPNRAEIGMRCIDCFWYCKAAQLKHKGALCSIPELKAMWARCGGKCERCQKPLELGSRYTHFDHSHVSGQMRQVLCLNDNHAQGHVDAGRVVWA